MAPPMQVAAPPKGSISVGWLCVSFLNKSSQGSCVPLLSTSIFTLQALISSDSSRPFKTPFFLRYLPPMVPISIRHMGFSCLPAYTSLRMARYRAYAFSSVSLPGTTSSRMVPNVVWRQWSDQ